MSTTIAMSSNNEQNEQRIFNALAYSQQYSLYNYGGSGNLGEDDPHYILNRKQNVKSDDNRYLANGSFYGQYNIPDLTMGENSLNAYYYFNENENQDFMSDEKSQYEMTVINYKDESNWQIDSRTITQQLTFRYITNNSDVLYKYEIYISNNTDIQEYIDSQSFTNPTYIIDSRQEIKNKPETQLLVSDSQILNYDLNDLVYGNPNYYTQVSGININKGNFYLIIFGEYISNENYIEIQATTSTTNDLSYIRLNNYQKVSEGIQFTIPDLPPVEIEVINLPELIFTILTMPFSFISTAFNLTLFSGTPYAINVSNLFLAIIAVLIFIFIMKIIVMRGK